MTPSFVLEMEHGVVVGLPIPPGWRRDEAEAALHEEERLLASTWGDARVRTFAAGRVAARAALRAVGYADVGPILKTARGAPLLPGPAQVSVSHKESLAVALATRAAGLCVGVDVEEASAARAHDISRHVLTDAEHAALAFLHVQARDAAVRIRFSLKEALYKALDPYVQRHVGFHEVEVDVRPDGRADFALALRLGEGPFVGAGTFRLLDDHILTTAWVARGGSSASSAR